MDLTSHSQDLRKYKRGQSTTSNKHSNLQFRSDGNFERRKSKFKGKGSCTSQDGTNSKEADVKLVGMGGKDGKHVLYYRWETGSM